MTLKVTKVRDSISRPEIETNLSTLLVDRRSDNEGKMLEEIQLDPQEQVHVFLGNYHNDDMLRGFSFELSPKEEASEIVRKITKLGLSEDRYELTLHIASYSTRTVSVEVWRL